MSASLMEPMKVTVKHTFVDVPATRDFSLEGFLNEREIKSCPASRMVSLEDEPPTFSIPPFAQPAMTPKFSAPRDCTVDSLEEFFMDRETKSASAVSTNVQVPLLNVTPMFMAPRDSTVDSLEEFFMDRELKPSTTAFPEVVLPMANPGIEFSSFFQYPLLSDVSTAASSTGESPEPLTPDLSDDEVDNHAEKKLTISLTDGLGIESRGSAEHMAGTCKPCAFNWKPEGCQHGQNCKFCHLCPIGEVKKRKKEKLILRKMAKAYQNQPNHFYGMY